MHGVLQLALLGGFAARPASGPALSLPRKKSEALLAYLAMHTGQAQARDKLAALLWGDASDTRARHSLRQALVALRRAIPRGRAPLLVEDGDAVALNPAAVDVDVARFEALIADGTPDALAQAAELYRGDLLEGLAITEPRYEEWLLPERERLRELALEALVRLLAHRTRAGATDEAVQTAIRALGLDPAQEAVHRSLMRLYAHQGRRGAALRQYQVCVRVLERELGVEPEPETRRLYRELLQAGWDASAGVSPADGPVSDTPLVGRDVELARLRGALDEAWRGRGAVALVQGEAGVGKSRLVAATAELALRAGGHLLLGRAHESEQVLPFSPWVDALRAGRVVADMREELNDPWRTELSRLFPELGRGAPEPPGGEDCVRLFEAMARVVQYLSAGRPLLVVLEDLHWADEMSHRLMVFLARRITDWPVFMLGTVRVEELVDATFVRRSLAQLARQSRFVSVSLAPLSDGETRVLVRGLARPTLEESAVERLAAHVWRASEGNPFMIVETLRALGPHPFVPRDEARMPPPVREMIAGRLERLTDPGRRVMQAAGVIGRDFDFAVLTQAAGVGATEAAEGVDELVARRILHAVGDRLDFTHDRIREVAYDLLSPPHRKVLHAAVARALEATHGGDLSGQALALGRHHAASDAWDRAWPYLAEAGTRAARRSAHREAVVCFEQALAALGHLAEHPELVARAIDLRFALRQSSVPLRDHERILRHLGLAEAGARAIGDRGRLAWALVYQIHGLFLAGDGAAALDAGRQALALAEETGDPALQESAVFYLAQVHHWLGDYGRGAELLRRTATSLELELARHGAPAGYFVTSRMLLAWCLAELGEFDEALAWADEAVQAAEHRATAYDLVHAYAGTGLVHLRRGDFAASVAASDRAVDLCRGRDFSALWAIPASILARAYAATGRVTEAITLLEQAADIAAALGAPVLEFLADAHLLAGKRDEARTIADRALRLAMDHGSKGWEAWTMRLLGDIAAHRPGGEHEAAEHYSRALARAEALNMRPLAAHCHRGLGLLYRGAGSVALAEAHLGNATAMYREMGMQSWLSTSDGQPVS